MSFVTSVQVKTVLEAELQCSVSLNYFSKQSFVYGGTQVIPNALLYCYFISHSIKRGNFMISLFVIDILVKL